VIPGWECCKPRVLTFDEFLAIPPCTTGKHSTVDDTPPEAKAAAEAREREQLARAPRPVKAAEQTLRAPVAAPPPRPKSPEPEPESEDDDPSLPVPPNATCRRRACGASATADASRGSRAGEKCVFHAGHPVFHEGSKGWTCCKRRVLEFDEFMRMEGCVVKDRHKFVGAGKKSNTNNTKANGGGGAAEREAADVRLDFYQTSTAVHVSLFLKKIDRARARVEFGAEAVDVDLPTSERTRYRAQIPLYGPIAPERSTFRIMGTKVEMALMKADARGWPVLRSDERDTGEIIQAGKAL